MVILGCRQLQAVLSGYATHYNRHRPHRSLGQMLPMGAAPPSACAATFRVARRDRLGGLIHEYAHVG
jgi:hypothetical protein